MVLLSIATALLVANLAHPASRIAQFYDLDLYVG